MIQLLSQLKIWYEGLQEEGQTLVEYALILVLIAIVVILALIFLGGEIGDILNSIGNVLSDYPAD